MKTPSTSKHDRFEASRERSRVKHSLRQLLLRRQQAQTEARVVRELEESGDLAQQMLIEDNLLERHGEETGQSVKRGTQRVMKGMKDRKVEEGTNSVRRYEWDQLQYEALGDEKY